MAYAIELEGLRKEYRQRRGKTVAVSGLDLAVPVGGVHGFLGPNGSGKTTTIRCLLGLVRPTAGSIRLLGRPVPDGLCDTLRRVGAIVETPALFPTMSGRENLRLLASIHGVSARAVDDALETVGLAERGGDLVKKYSLGMRQRLALGAALLKDPEVLVLDEPANGLDPAGMREVRDLLRRLAADGRTVFVSSHILSEIQLICDRVAILHRGRCVVHGTVDEVMAAAGRPHRVVVKLADVESGLAALRDAGLCAEQVDGHVRVLASPSHGESINRTLAARGLWASEIRAEQQSLEDLFLQLTNDDGAGEDIEVDRVEVRQ